MAKLTNWHTLIAISTAKVWEDFQDDVPTAFTKATLKETVIKIWGNFPYAPMLGSIMYAMKSTRPDLCHAVSILARYIKDPKKEHCELIAHLYRYAKANPYRLRYNLGPHFHTLNLGIGLTLPVKEGVKD